ncbi:HAD-IIIC family phosphatase [Paenibacillus sp. NPDC057934]|uniref:HAD-IIIC family phosphatase n=1 Tax=Paenibacillus sp. NPDC057934 TaxID=3346282 RepID=UPI0036DE9014
MIKCVVWDLDGTIWDGILSENWDVHLFLGIHKVIQKLDQCGILQTIASRNNESLVNKKLTELGIRSYFVLSQCNWGSKTDSLKRISDKLNISLDSLVFIDNDPFELYEVNVYLPQVKTLNASDFDHLLELTRSEEERSEETSQRRELIKLKLVRDEFESAFIGSREDFLKSCEMKLNVHLAKDKDVPRIFELSRRTNQLNNLSEKVSLATVQGYLKLPNKICYVSELSDRFGYHGLIGVCFLTKEEGHVNIDLFCISCRVEGRGVGTGFLYEVIHQIQENWPNVSTVKVKYQMTIKNLPAKILLELVGFKAIKKKGNEVLYELPLPHVQSMPDWIEVNRINRQ